MSALDGWTWAAIAVLVAGSAAVFAWFLVEAAREWRRRRRGDQASAPRA